MLFFIPFYYFIEADIYKMKSNLEQSALAISNRNVKGKVPVADGRVKRPRAESPANVIDPMVAFLADYSNSKKSDISLQVCFMIYFYLYVLF